MEKWGPPVMGVALVGLGILCIQQILNTLKGF